MVYWHLILCGQNLSKTITTGEIRGGIFYGELSPAGVAQHTAFLDCVLSTMLPFSDFCMVLFFLFFRRYHCADHRKTNHNRQHHTIRYPKEKKTENGVDFPCASAPTPPPPSHASPLFSVSVSLKVLEERCHAACGLQA